MATDRRKTQEIQDLELYKKDLLKEAERERRESQLKRILEAQQQKKVWKYTFTCCVLLNIALLIMGLIGVFR